MKQPILVETTIVFESCFTCGIPIAMTPGQQSRYDESGMTIKCVLGHGTMRRESENQRLQRELRLAQDACMNCGEPCWKGWSLCPICIKLRRSLEAFNKRRRDWRK